MNLTFLELLPDMLSSNGTTYLDFVKKIDNNMQPPTGSGEESSALSGILGLLKGADLLPSEFDSLVSLVQTLSANKQLTALKALEIYLQALQLVNQAKFNKSEFAEAKKSVSANKASGDVAITQNGKLVVLNPDGTLGTIAPENLSAKSTVLTNGDLIRLRSESDKYAFNNEIFNILQGAVSYDSVTKILKDGVKGLGSESRVSKTVAESIDLLLAARDQLLEQYANGDISKDLLLQALSLEGLYNNKILSKNQYDQIKHALTYLWSTIPELVKTWLKYHSDGTKSGAIKLMNELALSGESHVIDDESSFSKKSSGKQKSKDGAENPVGRFSGNDKTHVSAPLAWYLGTVPANDWQYITFNQGTNYAFGNFTFRSAITNSSGGNMGFTTLEDVENNSLFGSVLDFQKATFAGQQYIQNASGVAVDANNLYSIDLPIDMEEYKENGNIKPDMSFLKLVGEIDLYVRENNITDTEEINRLYVQKGIPVKYTSDGKRLNTSQWRRFGVLNGYAISNATWDDLDDTGLLPGTYKEIDEDDNSAEFTKVNRAINLANGFTGNDLTKKNIAGDVYKGLIFVPVTGTYVDAMIAGKQYPYETYYNDYLSAQSTSDTQNEVAGLARQALQYYE